MKKIIAKLYKWSTATRWDENLMLPLYITPIPDHFFKNP
jgi:hypothetical protein